MKENILITGARAPVCLDLARKFHAHNYNVVIMDCISTPLSRFSNAISGYKKTSSPRFSNHKFSNQVKKFIHQFDAKLLIPTCEEAFYLSKLKGEMSLNENSGAIFCDELNQLEKLHSKYEFSQISQKWLIKTPETFLIHSHEDWQNLKNSHSLSSTQFVFKPVYSRFATETSVGPTEEQLERLNFSGAQWVAQRKINGEEVCIYGVANKGKLRAFAAYRPTYRVGLGAGIYLEPFYDSKLVSFCEEFAESINYHGQFAFDVMYEKATGHRYLLECNPRSTSGVHFFDNSLVQAFTDETNEILFGQRKHPMMMSSAVLIYSMPRNFQLREWKTFYKNFHRARDFFWSLSDPLPSFGQYVSFLSFVLKGLLKAHSAHRISVEDIEYNG